MFEGGKTPLVPLARLEALGYRIVIVPSDLQRAAIRAMQDVLAVMRRDGNSRAVADRMATFDERETVVNTREYLRLDARYEVRAGESTFGTSQGGAR
jgi:2-methylisocitrate lyase-like PEP mutase family enzyme